MDPRIYLVNAELDYLKEIAKQVSDRPDDAYFDSLEIDLYELLWVAWLGQLKYLSVALPREEFIKHVAATLGPVFATRVSGKTSDLINKTYVKARELSAGEIGIKVVWGVHDSRTIDFLRDYTVFWIGKYYDRFLQEDVAKIIREGLEAGKSTAQIGDELQEIFSGKLEPDKLPRLATSQYPWLYWRGLARNAITRARNFAIMNSLEQAGVKYYEIRAVRDGRTCRYCRNMHGRIFPVSVGKQNVETFLRMRDPESVMRKFPWVKSFDDVGVPTRDIKLAHALPPYHFNCRCTFVAKFESVEEEAKRLLTDPAFQEEFPKRMLISVEKPPRWVPENEQEALFMVKLARKEHFTKKEISEFLKKASWTEEGFKWHYDKHKRSFDKLPVFSGELSEERYRKLTERVLRNGEVLGVIDLQKGYPQLWVIARILNDRRYAIRVIVDVKNARILTVHPINIKKLEKGFRNLEMRYTIREEVRRITLKARVVKMRWKRENVRKAAEAYRDVVLAMKREFEEFGSVERYDVDVAFSNREDVIEHLAIADDRTKQILKEVDEVVLSNLELFKAGGDLHYLKPSLFWHNYIDWIIEGKLEVVWDDEFGIYVGKLKR